MPESQQQRLIDDHGRVIGDIRISLTDRCNFRCLYCLPETEEAANFYRNRWAPRAGGTPHARAQSGETPDPVTTETPIYYKWKPKADLLAYEEIERVVRLLSGVGVHKVRLTGGEPLLRRDVPSLVSRLAALETVRDLALTTNGFHFTSQARALRDAGLRRISFSLDSLDKDRFRQLTGRDGLNQVLDSIRLAQELGLFPIKVNAVIIRDLNDQEIPDLAEFALENQLSMRFIEFMPLDSKRAWQKELVVPGREITERIQSRFQLIPVLNEKNPSETARRWRFADIPARRVRTDIPQVAEIGVIAPVTEPFCGHCNRLRLTADGQVRTCLFSLVEHDLRTLLRNETSDEGILEWLAAVVRGKEAGHRIGQQDFIQPERTMSCIGG